MTISKKQTDKNMETVETYKEATRLIKLCKDKLYKVDEEVKKVLEELDE